MLLKRSAVSLAANRSLCCEVLPFVFDEKGRHDSFVIVVSQLISLMVGQIQSLRPQSVRAVVMSSGSKVDKLERILGN